MPTLTIRQQQEFNATLSIDQAGDYPITISDPFSPEEEKRLEWYFEEHLRFPFTDGKKAEAAAASVTQYGERLFEQLFADRNSFSEYKAAVYSGLDNLTIEIIGKPNFHQLHWEALKDPGLPDPFAIHANIVRRRPTPQTVRAALTQSPTINVLVVTARPSGSADVGYRTISRPLIETLRQTPLRVNIDLLRPGSYRALVRQLEAKPVGYYHVIHFDVHGALLEYDQVKVTNKQEQIFFRSRYGRGEIKPYEGKLGYLALEGESEGQADFVEAGELAKLLITRQTPMVILNACQSGKQVGASETSLGARLMEAGVQTVLAMSYSVTVSAAEQLMGVLYRQLFDSQPLAVSIRRARAELHRQKERRGYYSQRVALEDWLLPVVYSVGESHNRSLRVSEDTEAVKAWWQRKAEIDAYRQSRRQPTYGFWGRDIDILTIERRLLAGDFVESNTGGSQPSNILLIQGMGGAGKSTLIHHLADWWRTTHLVERVFYFGYDEKAWTLQQMLHELARQLLDPNTLSTLFLPANLAMQQSMIVQQLASQRHLLLLDNLESITGSPLAIPNTLPTDEQKKLADFVFALWGGRTLLLLGSRAPEAWLLQRLGNPVYELGGLDPEAASALSDAILQRTLSSERAEEQSEDPNLPRLLRLLAGYPLALEVVLPNLAQQSVAEVLQALEEGDIALDSATANDESVDEGDAASASRVPHSDLRTRSILRCIDYSHSNLDPEAQQLLLCLAPFSGVIDPRFLPQYIEQLHQQAALAHLPWQRLPAVVEQAKGWGLLEADPQFPDFLHLQPIFPWFLRNRLRMKSNSLENEQQIMWTAIEVAFRQHYNDIGNELIRLQKSKIAEERQLGYWIATIECENLLHALRNALASCEGFVNLYVPLALLSKQTQNHEQSLELNQMILNQAERYNNKRFSGAIADDFLLVMDDTAQELMQLKRLAPAEQMFQMCLEWLEQRTDTSQEQLTFMKAAIYHNLGMVSQEGRLWEQAEKYYHEALQLNEQLNDESYQTGTYYQLGMLARDRHKWDLAERYYKRALQICISYRDRYHQARIYQELSIVAQYQQQWTQAEHCCNEALKIKEEFGDLCAQAHTYHQLGRIMEQQQQWDNAEHYYKEALRIKIECSDHYSQAETYHQLGIVAQTKGQLEQAKSYFEKAKDICVEFKHFSQAFPLHQLGMIAHQQKQWEQANYHYQEALNIFIDIEDHYWQAHTYSELGLMAQEQNHWQQAKIYYLTALQTFIDYQDQNKSTTVLNRISLLWLASNDGSLPAAVAGLLGLSVAEVEALLRKMTAG